MKRIIGLFIIFVLAFPLASIAGEPAWWTQKKRECGLSSGLAYNTWESQGSPCNNGGGSSGGLSTDSTTNMIQGIMNNNSQQFGIGLFGAIINDASRRNSAESARQAEEEQRRAAEQVPLQRGIVESLGFALLNHNLPLPPQKANIQQGCMPARLQTDFPHKGNSIIQPLCAG